MQYNHKVGWTGKHQNVRKSGKTTHSTIQYQPHGNTRIK